MTKTIKLTDKIPRVDIDHYLAANTEENRVCVLSERDVTVIRSYLFPGVEWSTRFVRPLGGDNYETGTEEEFSEYLEALNELDYKLSGGFTMALEDALIAIANAITTAATANASAFNSIASSINVHANAQCCDTPFGSEGGVQGTIDTGDTGPIPIYGETPISYGREPGTYPPEFETEEGYLINRCAIANMIVDGVVGTLHGYAAFTVFNATALVALIALATASIIIMPPVAIPVMVGCILALVGFTTYFEGMADEIQANRQDYVCALYEGETIEVMISLLADFIDAILLTLGGAGWVNTILKQVFLLLNNPDTLKQLFDGVAGAAYEGADCSSCVGDCIGADLTLWSVELGTVITQEANTLRVDPEYASTYYYVDALLGIDPVVISQVEFSFAASEASNFQVSLYLYTASSPYPGTAEETIVQTQVPPLNILFEPTTTAEISQVLVDIRTVSQNDDYDWAEISGMCIS